MDVLSHGLWGAVVFGRKSKKIFWQTFAVGIASDIFSFDIFFFMALFGFVERPDFSHNSPNPELIPVHIDQLYNITHSLVIFAAVFLIA